MFNSEFSNLKLVRTLLNTRVLGTSTAAIFLSNDHSLYAPIYLGWISCLISFVWHHLTCQESIESEKCKMKNSCSQWDSNPQKTRNHDQAFYLIWSLHVENKHRTCTSLYYLYDMAIFQHVTQNSTFTRQNTINVIILEFKPMYILVQEVNVYIKVI